MFTRSLYLLTLNCSARRVWQFKTPFRVIILPSKVNLEDGTYIVRLILDRYRVVSLTPVCRQNPFSTILQHDDEFEILIV